jgi:hypothetical protein
MWRAFNQSAFGVLLAVAPRTVNVVKTYFFFCIYRNPRQPGLG